jgi:hypothetical protein
MIEIYVPLGDEGVEVWRPVTARQLSASVFEIPLGTPVPSDESWLYRPGDQVRCELRPLSGAPVLVAVELISHAG